MNKELKIEEEIKNPETKTAAAGEKKVEEKWEAVSGSQFKSESGENMRRTVEREKNTGKEREIYDKEIRPGVWQKTGEIKIEEYINEEKTQRAVSWVEIPPGAKDRHIFYEAEEWNKREGRWEKMPSTKQDMGLEKNPK